MSRTRAKAVLSMQDYQKTMEGVYTTSVNEATLDEAPMAYKSLADIIDVIRDSVDVIDIMKPIYNFKASDEDNEGVPPVLAGSRNRRNKKWL